MSKYSGFEGIASICFVIFVLSWTILRLIYYPFWILWSTRWLLCAAWKLYTNTYWESRYLWYIVAWATSLYIDKKSWICVCVCVCVCLRYLYRCMVKSITSYHLFKVKTCFSMRNLRITPLFCQDRMILSAFFCLICNGRYLLYVKRVPCISLIGSNSTFSFRFLQCKSFS